MWLFPKHWVVVEYCLYLFVAYTLAFLIHPKTKIKAFYPFVVLFIIEIGLILYGKYFILGGFFVSKNLAIVYYSLVLACIQWPIALIYAIYFRVKHIKEIDAKRLEEIKKRKQQKRAKPNKH